MYKNLILLWLSSIFFSNCSLFIQRPVQVEIISPTKTILHPITKNALIPIEGRISEVIVEVKDRQVRVISSDCPDQICIKIGWISYQYEFILCAPNQVSVRIRYVSDQPDKKITY